MGSQFSGQPVVSLLKPDGSVLTDFNGPVTVTLQSDSGTAGTDLVGSTTLNAVNGVATFSGLSLDQTGTGFVLVASIGPDYIVGPISSIPFDVTSDSAGIPSVISAVGGSGQSAIFNTALANPFQASVTDSAGSSVVGATVTFSAPAGAASGSFEGGAATATATTNGQGIATAPAFTVNSSAGGYTVNATVSGVITPALFAVANIGPQPVGPDLSLTQADLAFSDPAPQKNAPLTLNLTLHNNGDVDITAVSVLVTDTLVPTNTVVATYPVTLTNLLAAHGQLVVPDGIALATGQSGNHSICVQAQINTTQPADQSDTNLANNQICQNLAVLEPAPPNPQLKVKVSDLVAWPGANLTLLATVQNTGNVPLTINSADIPAASGANVTLKTTLPVSPTILPGDETQLSFDITIPSAVGASLTLPFDQNLTVNVGSSEGATGSATFKLQTLSEAPTSVTVTVLDTNTNQALGNTYLMIENSDEVYLTGPDGRVVIPTTPGDHTIYSYQPNYLSQADDVSFQVGTTNTTTIKLTPGQTFEVSDVTATPLTAEQAQARGVNLTDPANQVVYDFVIYLKIGDPIYVYNIVMPTNPAPGTEVTYSAGGGGCSCGGGDSGPVIYGTSHFFALGQRLDTWIIIPGRFRILKQFWDASIYLKNNSIAANPNSIVITNIQATLQLPPGLSLPELGGVPQLVTQNIDPIPAGQGRQVSWVVRGDVPGAYLLPAHVSGDVKYLNVTNPIHLDIDAQPAQLVVYAPTLDVSYLVPSEVTAGVPFDLQITFINTTPVALFGVSVELLEDQLHNVSLSSPATVTVGAMQPAQTNIAHFTLVPAISGCVLMPESFVASDPHITSHLNFSPSSCGGLLSHTECWTVCMPLGGQMSMSDQDIGLPASTDTTKMGLDLVRTYNSADKTIGSFGLGAHSNYDFTASTGSDGSVTITNPDGSQEVYKTASGGGFTTPPGGTKILIKSGASYVLTSPDQLSYVFDSSGRLVQIRDATLNHTNITYALDGSLANVTDNYHHVLTITTNAKRITAATDGTRHVTYGYDPGFNRVESVTDPRGFTTHYEYDSTGLLLVKRDQFNNIVLRNAYDGQSRVLSQTTYAGSAPDQAYTTRYDYTSQPGKTIMTDGRGNPITFTLNPVTQQPINIVNSLGYNRTTILDSNFRPIAVYAPNGAVVRSEYNAAGLPTVITSQVTSAGVSQTLMARTDYNQFNDPTTLTDVLGNTTSFHYAYPGKPDTVTNPLGQIVRYQYDGQGRLIKITSIDGMLTTYGYDSYGQVSAITKTLKTLVPGNTTPISKTYRSDYQFTPQGWLTYQSDPYDIATGATGGVHYEYDAEGRITALTNQLGQRGTNQYDAAGNLTVKLNVMGQKTIYTYDWLNRLTTVTEVAAAGNLVTTYHYDQNNNMTSRIDPKGVVTSYTYDPLNRLVKTVVPLLDGSQDVVENVYDSMGNQTGLIHRNPKGQSDQVTTFQYDELNRLVGQTLGAGSFNYQTQFVYDKADNLLLTRSSKGSGQAVTDWNSPSQVVTNAMTYDALNRPLTNQINAWDPRSGNHLLTTVNNYDDSQNLHTIISPYGIVSTAQLDSVGRPIIETVTPASGSGIQGGATVQKSFNFYDARNLLLRSLDPVNNRQDFGYDLLGRAISSTVYTGPNGTGTALTSRTYYRDGLLPEVTAVGPAPNFVRQDTFYDELGRVTSQVGYTGAPVSYPALPANALTVRYGYDQQGNQTSLTDPKGHTINYKYDNTGWLLSTQEAVTLGSGPAQSKLTAYQYDSVGNLLSLTDANNRSLIYQYDALNRQTSTQDPLGNTYSSSYDGLGEVLTSRDAKGQTTAYQYDNSARLINLSTNGTLTTTYLYNDADLPTSHTDQLIPVPGGSQTSQTTAYTYDGFSRLISVTNPQGLVKYDYDTLGQRTGLTFGYTPNNLKKVGYQYDALGRLTKLTNGQNDSLNLQYTGDFLTKATYPNGTQAAFTYDGEGRLTTLLQSKGSPVNTANILYRGVYTLDPLGNTLSATETSQANNRTVKYTYDELSHVISESTKVGTNPLELNTYRYDLIGNRLQENSQPSPNLQFQTLYGYDGAYRLISDTFQAVNSTSRYTSNHAYAYDQNSNLLSSLFVEHGVRPRTAPVQATQTNLDGQPDLSEETDYGALFGLDDPGADAAATPDDPQAAALPLPTRTQLISYTYDVRNRLVQWQRRNNNGQVGTVSYSYDGANHRIGMNNNNTLTTFLEDSAGGGAVLEEVVNGRPNYNYLYEPGSASPIFRASAGTGTGPGLWYHYDQNGSVRALSNASNGNLLDSYSFDAFGVTTASSGVTANNRQFEGEQLDPTGLYFNGCSYYQPSVAQRIGGNNCQALPTGAGSGGGPRGAGSGMGALSANHLGKTLHQSPPQALPCQCVVECDRQLDLIKAPDPSRIRVEIVGGDGPVTGFLRGVVGMVEHSAEELLHEGANLLHSLERLGQSSLDFGSGLLHGNLDLEAFGNMVQSSQQIVKNPVFGMIVSSLPVVGPAKMLLDAVTGHDLFTGRALSGWERVLSGLPVVMEVGGALLEEVSKGITQATELGGESAAADTVTDAVKADPQALQGAERATKGAGQLGEDAQQITKEADSLAQDLETGEAEAGASRNKVCENFEEFEQRYGDKFQAEPTSGNWKANITRDEHLQAGWKAYQSSSNPASDLVIGSRNDTEAADKVFGLNRLNQEEWSLEVNDAWIQGGIDRQANFYLATEPTGGPTSIEGGSLWNTDENRPRVFSRELDQLRGANYVQHLDGWMNH